MNKHLYLFVEIINVIVCVHFLYDKQLKPSLTNISLACFDILVFELVHFYGLNRILTISIYLFIFLYNLALAGNTLGRAVLSSMLTAVFVSLLPLLMGMPWMYFIADTFGPDSTALIANTLTFLCLLAFRKFLSRLFQLLCSRNEIIYLSITLFAFSIAVCLNKYQKSKSLAFEQMFFLLIFGTLIIVMSYYWQKEREQLHMREMEAKMHETYDASFQSLIASIRAKQHDFHNHLQTLLCMHYTIHTYEDLVREQEKYCSELMHNPSYYGLLNSKNPILSGFLYGKFLDADKQNVKISYSVSATDRPGPIPEYILIEMIGILWDNALEYVTEKENKKHISIRLEEMPESIEIEIGNPIDDISYEDITEFFQWGKSGKENHSGIGLAKLIKYREKYKFLLIADKRIHQECTWFFIKIIINRKPPSKHDGF